MKLVGDLGGIKFYTLAENEIVLSGEAARTIMSFLESNFIMKRDKNINSKNSTEQIMPINIPACPRCRGGLVSLRGYCNECDNLFEI